MTPRIAKARRGARARSRRLHAEFLELRLALSGQNLFGPELLTGPLPGAEPVGPDLTHANALAAIAAVTTSAPSDEFMLIPDPAFAGPQGSDLPGAALEEAGSLIGMPAFRGDARFAGIDGSGYAVVIIDSGIDLDHPFFGPDTDGNGVADRIVYNADFAEGAANAADLNGHGTHVSSIIASQDATYSGVAPGVDIIHLRVLDAAGSGTAASIESALQWVVNHVDEYNIVGVNMSLSFSDNASTPTTRPGLGLFDELAALAAQDVIVASASGNAYFSYGGAPGVSYPSADPNSLSVGAVWDADMGGPVQWASGARDNTTGSDRIVSFSQRHPTLTTVFAPGAAITAAAIGGGTTVLSGTSMATPIITGVAAIMQQLAVQTTGNRLSLTEFAELVRDTGVPVHDGDDEDDNVPNTQQAYHRVDVTALADAILNPGLSNLTLPRGMSLASSTLPAGGTARLDFTVANQSIAGSGPFTTAIYLSTDAVIDSSDALLMEITDELAAGASVARSQFAVALPEGLSAGQYYIGALVDAQGVVLESNEGNNSDARTLVITDDSGEISLLDLATNHEIAAGATINFGEIIQGTGNIVRSFTITNDGNVDLLLTPPTVPAGFAINGFPPTVESGATVSFTIELVSSSAVGDYDSDVSFEANDADESPFTINLLGSILEPDDHGNDAAHATIVDAGTTTGGKILRDGDVDWFGFAAVQGVQYRLATILQTLGDSELRLVDVNGTTQLVFNDDGLNSPASEIYWAAPADGVYFVEVKGKNGLEGTYQLGIEAGDDHGNLAAAATPVADPSTTLGVLETPGDSDWFSFVAAAAVEFRFETLLTSLGGSRLRLFDMDGQTELASASSQNVGAGALLQWVAPASGTYFIVVDAAAPSSVGEYRLVVNADDDYGDDPANAFPADLPTSVVGRIDDPLDRDVFIFAAVAGAPYLFTASLADLPAASLRIIGPNGVTELAAEQGEPGASVEISWSPSISGDYFLQIEGADGIGAYSLDFAVADDHGDDAASASATTDPSINHGVIELSTDVDWFTFVAIEGSAYHFETTLKGLSAAHARLYAPDGLTELAAHGGVGMTPRIDWTAPADGQYFVAVNAVAGATLGGYQLAITGDDDHGDNPQNATAMSIPLGVNGSIGRPDDADWFSVEFLAGVEYRVSVSLSTLPGAQVRLVAPDGVIELSTGIGGNGVPASVTFMAPTAGAYFVEVTPVALEANASFVDPGGVIGDYEIAVSLVSELLGDFDGDVDVDGNDFLVWQRTLGQSVQLPTAPLDSNGFEDYPPGPLQAIPGESTLSWHQLGSPAASAVVQSGASAAGHQSVRIDRVYDPEIFDPLYGADAWWGVPLSNLAPTGPLVLVAWDMRVTATGAENGGLGPFFGVQTYDDHSGVIGLLGSLGVDATTMDVVYQREQDGSIVETGVKATSDAWYSFAMLFDFAASEFTIYFEGRPLRTNDFVDLELEDITLDRITDADFAALASQADESSQQMEGTAYVDNFRIAVGTMNELLPADANRDGVVDGLDLAVWRQNFGTDYSEVASGSLAERLPNEIDPAATADDYLDVDGAVDGSARLAVGSLLAIAQRNAEKLEPASTVTPSRKTYFAGNVAQTAARARDLVLTGWMDDSEGSIERRELAADRIESLADGDAAGGDGQIAADEFEAAWAEFFA
jgi:subtilisin family serine protease